MSVPAPTASSTRSSLLAESGTVPPAPPGRRRRRWRRRLAWGLGGGAVVIAVLGMAAWAGRVFLLNRLLASGNSVWKVRMDSLTLEGGLWRITGLKVIHADRTEPVFQCASATTNASLTGLLAGRLDDVVLESPVVVWRRGLRHDPPQPLTRLMAVVSWKSIKVTGGRMDLASSDHWTLTAARAEGQAGPGMCLNDGRVQVTAGALSFDEPRFALMLSGAPVPGFEARARNLTFTGSLNPEDGLLDLHDARFTGATVQAVRALPASGTVTGRQETPGQAVAVLYHSDADGARHPDRTPEPESTASFSSHSDPVRAVAIHGLNAEALEMKAVAPWKIAVTSDLSVRGFLWESAKALSTAEGIQFSRSSLALGGFLRIWLFHAEGNLTPLGPQISRLKPNG
ncbi:MAG: hypothetical protein EOP86_21900 [Verrucomicrobiaceae bacterium]|nr:MAG: hypothetical protein EOP86_21900 [Verrucomicrobiaceae bacterium]